MSMYVSEEIPHWVDPENKPSLVGQHSPTPMNGADAVSKVLHDDNLLIKILFCVDLPTTLVCAALVCKRWLQHASDREFLHCFRKLHPPRLIGFYVLEWSATVPSSPRFIPMLPPQHLERAAVIRRARFSLGTNQSGNISTYIMDCQNGRVLTKRRDGTTGGLEVHIPLCPERGKDIIPPLPIPNPQGRYVCSLSEILSREGVNGVSYFHVSMVSDKYGIYPMSRLGVYMLKDGVWCIHTSAMAHLPRPHLGIKSLLVGSKIYMPSDLGDIIIFDLTTSSFSVIQPPQGVENGSMNFFFSRADDASGVYIIHAKELQLRIWLQKGDTWLLVDTICLHDMFGNLRMPGCTVEDYHSLLRLIQVGDNAEFVFLQMRQCVFYLDIKGKTLCKVHEITKYDGSYCHINPLMMIWPPTFPALKDDPASFYSHKSAPAPAPWIGGQLLSRCWRTIRRCATIPR